MALLSTVYTSSGRLNRFLSAQGVIDFADHHDHEAVVEDVINEATVELDLYLWRYDAATLAASELVQRWATIFAARFICLRRGNVVPDSIETEFERIISLLTPVADGKRNIRGLALKRDLRPTFSNLTVDRRYIRSTVRVTKQNSSNVQSTLPRDTARDIGSPEVY